MKRFLLFTFTVLFIGALSGCSYLNNRITYGGNSKQFMAHIMNKDYDKCIALMNLKGKETNHGFTDTLKSNFDGFRGQLISDFGEDLDFTYLKAARMGT